MERAPNGVEAVRRYLQKQIDRRNERIALARKAAAAKPRRGTRRGQSATRPDVAERRAYRNALKVLNAIPSNRDTLAAVRLEAEELARVKSALARIYEVTQHPNHDIAAAGDWAIVEGEAQAALNIVHEAERNR